MNLPRLLRARRERPRYRRAAEERDELAASDQNCHLIPPAGGSGPDDSTNVVSQALLEKATVIDPKYGQALGLLAASHTFSAHMGWEDMAMAPPIAEHAAMAAILADSEDPWAHYALGCVYLFKRRFDDSLSEFELALRLNPNFSLAQGYYGLALSYCGRWEEASVAAHRALHGPSRTRSPARIFRASS